MRAILYRSGLLGPLCLQDIGSQEQAIASTKAVLTAVKPYMHTRMDQQRAFLFLSKVKPMVRGKPLAKGKPVLPLTLKQIFSAQFVKCGMSSQTISRSCSSRTCRSSIQRTRTPNPTASRMRITTIGHHRHAASSCMRVSRVCFARHPKQMSGHKMVKVV